MLTREEFNEKVADGTITNKEVNEYANAHGWDFILMFQKLSESFIEKYNDKVEWCLISEYQKLSESFIDKYKDKVSWYWISSNQKLSESFIEKHNNNIYWCNISEFQKLSESFIEKWKDNVSWYWISAYQKLSEPFIEKWSDKVYWNYISQYQKLSESFIDKYNDKVYWNCISAYQQLSESFIEKWQDKVNWKRISDNWIYKDTEFKKQQVMATGLYECHDDYFIAYKGIRSDRHSKYNFQYQYLPDNTYESWCDCSSNENSFGLSVWNYENAKEYSDELVVKVKVRYEDVGRVVHDGGKIRCFKIEVLN